LAKQQKKILKIVTANTAHANFLNAAATQAFSTIQPTSVQNIKTNKKKSFKLSKASAGGNSGSSIEQQRSTQQHAAGHVNDMPRRNPT
jgi:hypothetical protein